ncbi:uncharacterized protein Tco025E_08837, partial [Trypanosoma conorhini]
PAPFLRSVSPAVCISLPLLLSPFATGTNLRSTRDGLHGECGRVHGLLLLHRAHSFAHHFPFHFRSLTGTWTPRPCRSWGAEADERCRTFVCFPRDTSGLRPCTVRWEGAAGKQCGRRQRSGRGLRRRCLLGEFVWEGLIRRLVRAWGALPPPKCCGWCCISHHSVLGRLKKKKRIT